MTTSKKPAEPLTAAQLEVVQQLVEDRHAALRAEVESLIQAALDPLWESAVRYGERLALRAASGKLIGANQGGPTADGQPFDFVGKTHVAAHESFVIERGQG